MSEIKWIKISTNIFSDEKIKMIKSLPGGRDMLLIWFQLLSLAGRTNNAGIIYFTPQMPYTEEMLSISFDENLNTIKIALQTFKQFGMIEIDEDDFISITNWEKHQNIEGMERVKQLNAERNKKYRDRKKRIGTSDVRVTSRDGTDIDKELDKDIDINNNVTPSKKLKFSEDDLKVVDFFIQQIKKNNPNFKEPNKNSWANDIRLMVENDNRNRHDICRVIQFVQSDPFEMSNVLSTSKLRKRFDNLLMKANKGTSNHRIIENKEDEELGW
ncbi:hypothetical protein CN692_18745 [Bacillus sp. AFS002410]|uniref:phage replisome organizer N-terminal domain-containing protein n=1 Tax=Bacillus sp. AFS002410 TaxID=2033481 RepID=UPI000BF00597|nr:phage replisome organizer N-terminal domain-containing protein [Bacillus sp. AFS002410]PEJ56166.1 hypothetical protein CN692_18745 [Bacillus sp. AFS002410]